MHAFKNFLFKVYGRKAFRECPGCVASSRDPNCIIRKCCRQKDYTICAECTEMNSCEKLRHLVGSLENLKRVKAVGVDNWAEEMQEKVDAGYCQLDE